MRTALPHPGVKAVSAASSAKLATQLEMCWDSGTLEQRSFRRGNHSPRGIELDKGYSFRNGVIKVLFSECQHGALQERNRESASSRQHVICIPAPHKQGVCPGPRVAGQAVHRHGLREAEPVSPGGSGAAWTAPQHGA